MEANSYAFRTTLHTAFDAAGVAGGYGGGTDVYSGARDWAPGLYGPGGSCIDTARPFRVATAFPTDANSGNLLYVQSTLTQGGCSLATKNIGAGYGTAELTAALSRGMVLVVSHFRLDDMRSVSAPFRCRQSFNRTP
jgi:hypothetical protein